MKKFNFYDELIERSYWFVRLRWIATAGIILAVFFTANILRIHISVFPLYSVGFLLGLYNFFFYIYLRRIEKRKLNSSFPKEKQNEIPKGSNLSIVIDRIANTQISLDLLSLAALIHFSGGIENPFIFYFIFHMIIASVLLSRRISFLQATFAVSLFCSMVSLEYLGIMKHYHLRGFIDQSLYNNPVYVAGVSFVFISTLYIAVYMATSISSKLRERERNLKEANKLLMEQDRIKSEYVLRVTHDIKEHLAAIQSCIEPVTGGITGSLNNKQMDLLDRAEKRTEKLLFFVKALLEMTRIKLKESIQMEYFSIKDTVKSTLAHIETKARNKRLAISSHFDPGVDKIRGSRPYIEETISNLLANAVKYTAHNGKVDINISDKGNSVLIKIQDTGIGISEDELPKIFEEFYRASNAKGVEKDGTGLGLSIAKQVVKRHNGKIWVESKLGEGSTFYIRLPK
ncbi:MAG: HAMP domain-containing sensor histidine kinase [bacterium]